MISCETLEPHVVLASSTSCEVIQIFGGPFESNAPSFSRASHGIQKKKWYIKNPSHCLSQGQKA